MTMPYHFLESPYRVQGISDVISFSTQYGSENSVSYTAYNVLGAPIIYPRFGDHAHSFQFRTYGCWWNILPSSRKISSILPFGTVYESEEYLEVLYRHKVYPISMEIFETYNPGAVVKILCYSFEKERWVVLWKASEQNLPPDQSRRYEILFQTLVKFKTHYYRIEFNHKNLDYHYALDAIYLYGFDSIPIVDPMKETRTYSSRKDFDHRIIFALDQIDTSSKNECDNSSYEHFQHENELNTTVPKEELVLSYPPYTLSLCYFDFSELPVEILQYIMSFLDLETLCSVAQVNRLFHRLAYDPLLYRNLNLQLYWHKVNESTLKGLRSRLSSLKRLNLSWCGAGKTISTTSFIKFVRENCKLLTSLSLSSCQFITDVCIKAIAEYCHFLQDLKLDSCRNPHLTNAGFTAIAQIKTLNYLNLYRTTIDSNSLITIIKSCSKIEHLFIGSCVNVNHFEIISIIGKYLRKIKTLDLWRGNLITSLAVHEIAGKCNDLIELDLSWCPDIDACTGCIRELICNCPNLKKIFLSAIRTISSHDVNALANHCKNLEQLDILGSKEYNLASIEKNFQNG